jgi:hypothetical protein
VSLVRLLVDRQDTPSTLCLYQGRHWLLTDLKSFLKIPMAAVDARRRAVRGDWILVPDRSVCPRCTTVD